MECEHILNSTEPDFLEKLGELAKKLRATVCFEAIAGEMTGQIMSKMPFNSRCILYGCLSEENVCGIEPLLLIGRNQTLESFLLNFWIKEKSLWALSGIIRRCMKLMGNKTLHSNVLKRISLFEVE